VESNGGPGSVEVNFVGEFDYSIDPKGRVIVPARLRNGFGEQKAYVSCYLDGCLAVWTSEEFERRFVARARRLERRGREGRDIARAMISQSSFVELDSQWRLTIAPNLREYARLELDKPVKIVGAINHIELWEPGRWRDRVNPGLELLRSGTSIFDEDGADEYGEYGQFGEPAPAEPRQPAQVGASAAPGGAA
jgi:MraZ protein